VGGDFATHDKNRQANSLLDGLVSIIQNYWFIVDTDRVAAGQAGFFQMLRPICCIGTYCYSISVFSLILFPPFSCDEPLELKLRHQWSISPDFCTT